MADKRMNVSNKKKNCLKFKSFRVLKQNKIVITKIQ